MILETFEFRLWDLVQKRRGYRWPGVIVMRGHNLKGAARYVVECTVPEVKGALHIFAGKDLKRRRAPTNSAK